MRSDYNRLTYNFLNYLFLDCFMLVVKVPTSQGSLGKNPSCKNTPEKLIKASEEIFLNEKLEEVKFDVGKVDTFDGDIEKTNENIFNSKGDIFLGGDHSITYPLFSAFAQAYKNPGIIIFDAHADCVTYFKPPSHEDWVNVLVNDGLVKSENVILVGVRNLYKSELEFLREKNIRFIQAKDIFLNIEETCDFTMELAREFDGLYLSIDIDVLDPAFAPATGYLEPGGLTTRELLYFIQRLKRLKNLKRVDLVEVGDEEKTIKTAAKILAELI